MSSSGIKIQSKSWSGFWSCQNFCRTEPNFVSIYPHSTEIFRQYCRNIVRLLKYFETLLCPHRIWRMQYFPNIGKTSKCIDNVFLKKSYQKLSLDFSISIIKIQKVFYDEWYWKKKILEKLHIFVIFLTITGIRTDLPT